MSIPYFSTTSQECEYCESEIYVGYEAILHDDGIFCTRECLTDHLYETSNAQEVYITDDPVYMPDYTWEE